MDDHRTDDSARASNRPLWIALAAILAMVLIAVIVVFSRGSAEPLDPATPEGTVQAYLTAVLDGDDESAKALLGDALIEDCTPLEPYRGDGMRVTLGEVVERDDTATVDVVVTYTDGGLFGTSEYTTQERFRLALGGDDRWLIISTPWSFALCEEIAR